MPQAAVAVQLRIIAEVLNIQVAWENLDEHNPVCQSPFRS